MTACLLPASVYWEMSEHAYLQMQTGDQWLPRARATGVVVPGLQALLLCPQGVVSWLLSKVAARPFALRDFF